MKKLFFLLTSAVLLFGCQGRDGLMGPEGPQGPPGEGNNWDVYEVTVKSSDWKLSGTVNGDNSYYYADVNDSKLTSFVASSGNVTVYMYTDISNGNKIQTPLPYVWHRTDGKTLWTETYDFDFTVGSVALYVKYSDFNTVTVPPTTIFRVVKTW